MVARITIRELALVCLLAWAVPAQAITATLLFPSAGGTQYGAGNGVSREVIVFLVLETDVNATCKWDTTNVAYASMAHFFYNTGGWTYHSHRFFPANTDAAWPTYTYYYACQDDNTLATTTATSVTWTVDSTYPGTIPAEVQGIALADTRVKLDLEDPRSGVNVDNYKWYRNGSLIATNTQYTTFIDTGLTANTVYTYTASITISGVEQTQSPGYKVRTLPSGNHATNSGVVPKLEDFETGNFAINPGEANDWNKYLWNNYPFGDIAGTGYSDAVISTPVVASPPDGTHAFLAHMTGNFANPPYSHADSVYFTMLPFTDADNVRHFSREYLKSGSWAFNTFNRMRFWIKVPSTWQAQTGGHENMQVGTYVRSSHGDSAGAGAEESGNGGNHFYHLYNLPVTDSWYQIIVDTHISHQRGANGTIEWTNHAYFSGEPSWNYFDAFSRWYVDTACCAVSPTFPSDYYFDDIEFFNEDESLLDTDNIYSIHGGVDQGTHTIFVGWDHPKNDGTTKADVRYAFSDLYALGFTNGTVFPGTSGGVSPLADVYSCMLISSAAISIAGHANIYVGIRQQGDTGFRQIVIPLTNTPGPGSGLRLRIRGE